jgi:hypothetical protein
VRCVTSRIKEEIGGAEAERQEPGVYPFDVVSGNEKGPSGVDGPRHAAFGGALVQLPARPLVAPARGAVTVVVRAMMLPGGEAGRA